MTEYGNIFDTPLSADDVKEALKADLLPVGWHLGTELKYEEKVVAQGVNEGRPFVRIQATLPNLKNRKGFFNASPVFKLDKNEKVDLMYRLFAGLTQAVGGGATAGEVLSKLGYASIEFRVIHTKDDEEMVVAVRAPKAA